MREPLPEDPVARARELRRRQSPPERILWSRLRDRRLGGLKFRRQHPIGPYTADFYCHDARLVVEADGWSHVFSRTQDRARDEHMRSLGLLVMRVSAGDIARDLDLVMQRIARVARERVRMLAGPPAPTAGEGRGPAAG